MPVEMRMWRIDGDEPKPLTTSVLPAEKDLHEFLKRDPRCWASACWSSAAR